jgi:prolyl-tRNA synthetase
MKRSQLFVKTKKEISADEKAKNAQLLIRAGFIHKEMAGVYVYTPLGLRVLENIKKIVREEMNVIGGQEVMMSVLQPKELWQKTDRWEDEKVDNWFKTRLSNGAELGVGLTHEEPIVDMLSDYLSSYKDLPIIIYQIQSKFRNELRAKSGLLRGREFVMKDMYSFSRTQDEHDKIYEKIAEAYERVFERLGIGKVTFRVKADGGIFTERFSDEFQTITPIGEDTLFHDPETGEYFNEEIAPAMAPEVIDGDEKLKERQDVEGEGIIGVEQLAKFLQIPVEKTTKTMIYEAEDGRIIAAAVRGGYSINEIKLRKVVNAKKLKLADEETVNRLTNAKVGYAGILNLPDEVMLIVDESCNSRTNFETGANRTNYHTINVNWDRDISRPAKFYDIKVARSGDRNPESGNEYEVYKAVEVGNIFPLETKYTDALSVFYHDIVGEQKSIIMGCYGIGVSRLVGVLAEFFSDDKGLVWPEHIAPFRVYLATLGDTEEVLRAGEAVYQQLRGFGIEVLYDDRDVRPGEKFADADLMGIPHRLVISQRTLEKGSLEYKKRDEADSKFITVEDVLGMLQ